MDLIAGAAFAFVLAAVTAPVGVSGAFLLVPVQLSVLGVPAAQVAPTNLVFNIISIPGALARYRGRIPIDRRILWLLLAGSFPGVVIGAVLRTEVFTSDTAFVIIVAAVLGPIGLWLLFSKPLETHPDAEPARPNTAALLVLGLVTGVISGLYGIGGGVIFAPALVMMGVAITLIAPVSLLVTMLVSVGGIVAFLVLATPGVNTVPDWPLAAAMGAGGLAGAWVGAHYQPHISERHLRQLLGLLALALSIRYGIKAAL